jgi:hypothetical protein
MTGAVHTLYQGLHAVWPESSEWLTACHAEQDEYHGGSFTGNASRKLLRCVDQLAAMCPTQALPFAAAFRSLNRVVEACFSDTLSHNFLRELQNFQKAFLNLGISVTPKVHAIFFHVGEFCQQTGSGLGPWSEQCVESLHRDFLKHWERYKVSEAHPEFPNKLQAAVRCYNSRHL